MTAGIKIGELTQPSSTGNQAVTGVGFTPGLTMIATSLRTATGLATSAYFGLGAATSSSARWAIGHSHNTTAASVFRTANSSNIVSVCPTSANSTANAADFVSNDSDGFTINWNSLQDTSAFLDGYVCFGNHLQTSVGTFDLNTSTGNQSITGTGFQPDLIIIFSNLVSTTEVTSGTSGGYTSLGVATSSSNRWAAATRDTGSTPPNTHRYMADAKCLMHISSTAVDADADLVSMDSNGFTINVTTAPGSAIRFGYAAIKGLTNVKVGVLTTPTVTGNNAVTGTGFKPNAVLFGGFNSVINTYEAAQHMGFGGMTSSNQFFASANGANGGSPTQTRRSYQNAKTITFSSATASSLILEASYVSMDSDGFTLNWSTVDTINRVLGYIALNVPDVPLTPAAGSLTITGDVPTLALTSSLVPAVGSLTLIGNTPEFSTNTSLTPAAGNLLLTGNVASLLASINITPDGGSLLLTGDIPTVTAPIAITPTAGSLVIAGASPSLSASNSFTPGVGDLLINGDVPSVLFTIDVFPATGSLILSGAVPVVGFSVTLNPDAGSLLLTGYAPLVGQNTFVIPDAGELVITGDTPVLSSNVSIFPVAGNILLTGNTPIVARRNRESPRGVVHLNAEDGCIDASSQALTQVRCHPMTLSQSGTS